MLRQIINQHARKLRELNGTDEGLAEAVAKNIGAKPSIVMQMLDPDKYANQIAQAHLEEQYADQQEREAALQAAAEAKALADAESEQARLVAQAQATEAERVLQQNIGRIKEIYTEWMKAPTAHTRRSFYIYVKNSFGIDPATVESAVDGQPWFILEQ